MKKRDLEQKLIKAGWKLTHGGKHDLATHTDHPGTKLTIPRSNEIDEHTARGILKDAGLK